LHASGASPLHALRVRDPHVPARLLEPVVDEASTRHRLDRRHHRALLGRQATHQVDEPVAIGRTGADGDPLAIGEQRVPVKTLAAEAKSDVQHRWASFVR
jgi:hypothetical protein